MTPMADLVAKLNLHRATGALHRLAQPGPAPRRVFVCADCNAPIAGAYSRCPACVDTMIRVLRRDRAQPAMQSIPEVFRELWRDNDSLTRPVPPLNEPRVKERAAIGRALAGLKKHPSALVLRGAQGQGKTSLAAFLLGRVVMRAVDPSVSRTDFDRAASCRFVTAQQIAMARAEHGLGQGEPPLLSAAIRAWLLVLDEFGNKVPIARIHDVDELIHKRHSSGLTTIVTTPLSHTEIVAHYGETTARRAGDERTIPIDLGGVL